MRNSLVTVLRLLPVLLAPIALAQPAEALNADYWRGGWRTPLGEEPHIYQFVIRGTKVTGVYCRNCSDATTIGFIDGTWDEKTGINFKVTFARPDGSTASVDDQQATLVDGRLIVTGAANVRNAKSLALIKDPRGADPGGAPAYHLPPGTPPALPAGRGAAAGPAAAGRGAAGGGAPVAPGTAVAPAAPTAPGTQGAPGARAAGGAGAPATGGGAAGAGGGGGGRGPGGGAAAYWQAGPFKALRPTDVVGTWIASFGLGMNRQIFTFLLVGKELRGVVCGRCDNPYTIGAIENIIIVGDKLYFDIVHQDWGEIDPPTFDRSIVAQFVQNELLAGILGNSVVIDRANPPARPAGRGGFTLVGPIAPESTRGNSSEGVDVWGPGTGSTTQPPGGRTPIVPPTPGR